MKVYTGKRTCAKKPFFTSQTCLVKRVCTEDKSRPRSSDRAIPSLSPAKYNEFVERF